MDQANNPLNISTPNFIKCPSCGSSIHSRDREHGYDYNNGYGHEGKAEKGPCRPCNSCRECKSCLHESPHDQDPFWKKGLNFLLLAFVAVALFIILSIPSVDAFFADYIPSFYHRIFAKALILGLFVYFFDRFICRYRWDETWEP